MLKLRLNPEARPLRQLSAGFTFLGIHFKGRQRGLSEAKMNKIRDKLDWLTNKRRSQPLAQIIAKVQLVLCFRKTFINEKPFIPSPLMG